MFRFVSNLEIWLRLGVGGEGVEKVGGWIGLGLRVYRVEVVEGCGKYCEKRV